MLEGFYRFNITGEWIKLGLWELQMISIWNWNHHVPTTKSTPFMGSKDEWDTKEGYGKSMKNVLYA